MSLCRTAIPSTVILLILSLLIIPSRSHAQNDCGIVDNISYPIDKNSFLLAQDYAIPSPRHQGRFHTGEDWYGGREQTAGQPVRAAAKGRVTYAYRLGWGRDGGVVIVQHTLPDGTIFYTQYGHLDNNDTYPLPTRLTCVDQGEVIGTVGDARPAPHLHFEVRVINGADPGPGYSTEEPYDIGYRNPTKFITNLQAQFNRAYAWHTPIGQDSVIDERGIPAPLELNDNSLLYLDGDGDTLRRALPDGRVLWRQRFDTPAVAVTGFLGNPLVTFADGTLQFIDAENGTPGDFWQVDAQFTGAPLALNDIDIYPTPTGIAALSDDKREILWRADDLPAYTRIHATPDRLALLTDDNRVLVLSRTGDPLSETTLRAPADFATSPDGDLLVYSRGGLWQIDSSGDWTLYNETAPGGGTSGAVLVNNTQHYVFDGTTLTAYDTERSELWQTTVPDVRGQVALAAYDNLILLTSSGGNIAVASPEIGRLCNFMQVYGTDNARHWQSLGADNILRVAIADQIIGLDWGRFTQNC